jgi:hypothetical protein
VSEDPDSSEVARVTFAQPPELTAAGVRLDVSWDELGRLSAALERLFFGGAAAISLEPAPASGVLVHGEQPDARRAAEAATREWPGAVTLGIGEDALVDAAFGRLVELAVTAAKHRLALIPVVIRGHGATRDGQLAVAAPAGARPSRWTLSGAPSPHPALPVLELHTVGLDGLAATLDWPQIEAWIAALAATAGTRFSLVAADGRHVALELGAGPHSQRGEASGEDARLVIGRSDAEFLRAFLLGGLHERRFAVDHADVALGATQITLTVPFQPRR